jgi:TolB protein
MVSLIAAAGCTQPAPSSASLQPTLTARPDGPPLDTGTLSGRIVFVSLRDEADPQGCGSRPPGCDFDLFVMDADGTRVRRLTSGPDADTGPAIAPDGRTLAFSRAPPDGGESDLYVMSIGGGSPTRLADVAGNEFEPDWSPDGRRVVFARDQAPEVDGPVALWAIGADGGDLRPLGGGGDAQQWRDVSPSWSRDGAVVFVRTETAGAPTNDVILFGGPMHSSGSLLGPGSYSFVAWSPDGALAFSASVNGNEDIYVSAGDGSRVRRLTDAPAVDTYPAWSPDGRYLAFVSYRAEGIPGLWVMRVDGTGETPLGPPRQDGAPAWTA